MAETVTELRALAERLADEIPPEYEGVGRKGVDEVTPAEVEAYHWWSDTAARTVLAAAGENVDLLRDALAESWPRPAGTEAFPRTRAESMLADALYLAERWARPVADLAVELAEQLAWGFPAMPGRGYRHHPELVRLAREQIPSACERTLADHPEHAVPDDVALRLLDTFERAATRLTMQVVQ